MRRVFQIRIFYLPALVLGFCLLLLFPLTASAETLRDMEAILNRYPTLQDFLNDKNAVLEYRESLKAYMGEGAAFDPVFNEFITQIQDVALKIPDFAAQAWEKNQNWEKDSFAIQGNFSGTGLNTKREALLDAIEKIKSEAEAQGPLELANHGKNPSEAIASLTEALKNRYGLLPPEELSKLSKRKQAAYREQLATISSSPEIQILSSYVAHSLLTQDETLGDALHSADADITAAVLTEITRPVRRKSAIESLNLEIPNELLGYLSFSSPTHQAILQAYADGDASIKAFRHIADPRMDPELRAEMDRLLAEGVAMEVMYSSLNQANQRKFDEWRNNARETNHRKREFASKHNSKNPFFDYDLHEDAARATLRLKTQGGLSLHFKASPRSFHALFAGRKNGECVGGRDATNLTPRRWTRAALKGARTFFTETGDDKMEGAIGITPIVHDTDGSRFDVTDIMSRAIKGDIAERDSLGKIVKYSFFDRLVDALEMPESSRGLVISDGNSVSQNVGGGEVVLHSPAYLENQIVGKPSEFSPLDPMAKAIGETYPRGMYPGGMIYDGMKSDGTKVVRLVPTSQRKKWTKEELENRILSHVYLDDKIQDRDVVWKLARESGVSLRQYEYYRKKAQSELSDLNQVMENFKNEKLTGFPHFVFRNLMPTQISQDIALQNAFVDHLLATPFPEHSAKLRANLQSIAERLGKSGLTRENFIKIADRFRDCPDPLANSQWFIRLAFGTNNPRWMDRVQHLERLVKALPSGNFAVLNAFHPHLNVLIEQLDVLKDRGLDWQPAFVSLLDITAKFQKLVSTLESESEREELRLPRVWKMDKMGYASKFFSLIERRLDQSLTVEVARNLLNLPYDSSRVGAGINNYAWKLLAEDPEFIDDLVEKFLIRARYSDLEITANYLGWPNRVDPKKKELIFRLTKNEFGPLRKALALADYLFVTPLGSKWRKGRDWNDSKYQQIAAETSSRMIRLKEEWEALKAGKQKSFSKKISDACARGLKAIGELKGRF